MKKFWLYHWNDFSQSYLRIPYRDCFLEISRFH